MTSFTPWSALLGGALIGSSASLLLLFNGRVAGISGIVGGLLRPRPREMSWRALFVAGLLVGGLMLLLLRPASFGAAPVSLPLAIVAGLFVGFGARLGGGCTSGHGVCGLSRLSGRSLAATMTFMATGALAAFVVQHLVGAAR
ncbi:MAG: YeeE/YedE family protein [Myxococcota bacterium]|nr:YeeE/YedE family protein [Myxococcota bacterium]